MTEIPFPVEIISPERDHMPLIYDSLTQSSRSIVLKACPWITRAVWNREGRRVARESLREEHNILYAAVNPAEHWHMYGYAVFREGKPVWLYVKLPYRDQGLEELLLAAGRQ